MNAHIISVDELDELDSKSKESELSQRDRRILALERHWWKYTGSKDQAIRDIFSLNPTEYYQILNTLLDSEDALKYDALLVKRLRRSRSLRAQDRSSRRLGL